MKACKVAIQGVQSSFHDQAAQIFFRSKKMELVNCSSFVLLCHALREKEADFAVMAIENSIAGSILSNYSLLESSDFRILAELYLKIELNLMVLPGQKIQDIRYVKSHPIALRQCDSFLKQQVPEISVLEGTDTASSAKEIRDGKLKEYAAIGSRLVADTYELEILYRGIETNKQNYTRFLLLCRKEDYVQPYFANKASVRFEVPNRPGSLVEVLNIFYRHSLNMTKLQSLIIPGRSDEYLFHADLESEVSLSPSLVSALSELSQTALQSICYGIYSRGGIYA